MSFKKLRDLRTEIHDVNDFSGRPLPGFKKVTVTAPAKIVKNTRNDMALADLHIRGDLKWQDTGKTCSNCLNFYRDPNLPKGMGRCLARGYMQVHQDTPAEDRPHGWTDPNSGTHFSSWPACPLYSEGSRMSRR